MPQYKYHTNSGIRWFAKFQYTEPDTCGKKTHYKRGFLTKKAAKEYEEQFLENLSSSKEKITVKTFGDVFQEYLLSHKREDIKDSTLETKFNIFTKHIFPTFEMQPIDKITADDIASWQNMLKGKTLSDGSIFSDSYLRTIQSQFNSIVNYAYSKGYMRVNPLADIKNMGFKGKRVVYWTVEEYEKFAYHAMNYPECYYAFEVLYWCGLRSGELMALTVKDVDLKNGMISVTKSFRRANGQDIITTPKTPSSVRKVSMPNFLCEELEEYIESLYDPEPDQRIFLISKTALARYFKVITDEAGLQRIPVHGLRHSHVSLLISKKYDIFEVSKRIGHKSVATTQDIYGHLFDGVQKTIANDLDKLRRW